jgi:hypothetical protein
LASDWQRFSSSKEIIELDPKGGSDISSNVSGAFCGEKVAIRLRPASVIEEDSLYIWVRDPFDPVFEKAQ